MIEKLSTRSGRRKEAIIPTNVIQPIVLVCLESLQSRLDPEQVTEYNHSLSGKNS